ncbi:MAG: hypothetical protein BECKG1743D_GA0114223_100697 [Candidatus Kentron sp. G]|nr:MAG: hypothetical protein BECKG1743F_GA0114225_100697 [Candidatus Kentron sp. G]VFM96586.1 MAG: hypothetical protein BECKG1743E_GA0114224_100696 [Candidatus Kentron sp. G]VFM98543.1 MAG: hypothetical protein BECKG1743D_GA0114223_100697 [Candidatus Kentron sp. G]
MAGKDIIGKDTIRRLAVDIATHLLNLSIDPARVGCGERILVIIGNPAGWAVSD